MRCRRSTRYMRHEYSRLNRGKHQLRCGVAVPHTTPQARRAQNGMPVELPGLACPVSASASNAPGPLAGWWFADAARRGEALVAAGLLMLTVHVDLDELDRRVREGWERRRGAMVPYGPKRLAGRGALTVVLDRGVRQTY
jgi:hypothetical protein